MDDFRDFLRENNFFARALTYAMVPLFWRIFISIGRWYGYAHHLPSLKIFGILGIWVGVVAGYQLYYRWIFPEKRKVKRS